VKAALVISTRDNVATALEPLAAGQQLLIDGRDVVVRENVPAGHKIAIEAIPHGASVVKYGNPIGVATSDIVAGVHVHTHNVASTRGRGDIEAVREGPAWSRE
jgi:altronate dehydratase